jgi:hypothetical protein
LVRCEAAQSGTHESIPPIFGSTALDFRSAAQ